MKSRTKITRHIKMLFQAQGGLCFLCDQEMLLERGEQDPHDLVVSKEHVYPAGDQRRRSHDGHGVVLSHGRCNHDRGSRPVTAAEIAKAKAIHARLGTVSVPHTLPRPPDPPTTPRRQERFRQQEAEWRDLPFNPALPGLAERRKQDA